ncbi:hypothetical protein HYQ46_006527 [Verticillium longisporum]|nr:hypothetical protein HYQ46_006527 [Verticillium longisporum]
MRLSLERFGRACIMIAVITAARSSSRLKVAMDIIGRPLSDKGVPGLESGRMWLCKTCVLISSSSRSSSSWEISSLLHCQRWADEVIHNRWSIHTVELVCIVMHYAQNPMDPV